MKEGPTDKLDDLVHLSLFSPVGSIFCLTCQVLHVSPLVCPVCFSVLLPVSLSASLIWCLWLSSSTLSCSWLLSRYLVWSTHFSSVCIPGRLLWSVYRLLWSAPTVLMSHVPGGVCFSATTSAWNLCFSWKMKVLLALGSFSFCYIELLLVCLARSISPQLQFQGCSDKMVVTADIFFWLSQHASILSMSLWWPDHMPCRFQEVSLHCCFCCHILPFPWLYRVLCCHFPVLTLVTHHYLQLMAWCAL